MSESLPASQDPAGNWGNVTDGLQLSVRFRQHEYLSNQPVMAVIILRNLDPKSRTITMSDYIWQITLRHGTNTQDWKKAPVSREHGREDPGMSAFALKGGCEGITVFHINPLFELKPDEEYSVRVQMRVPGSDGNANTNIVSGWASFKIVKTLSPSEIKAEEIYLKHLKMFQEGVKK